MNIEDAENKIPGMKDMIKSANRFAIIVLCITAILALVGYFLTNEFLTDIAHPVELVQAILLCSTALMGLSGLMIFEGKKSNITGLDSDNGFVRVKAINTITSLARAFIFLRWVLLLSILTIAFCGLRLMIDNPLLIVCSLATFIDQIYFFIWGLLFFEFLPSS